MWDVKFTAKAKKQARYLPKDVYSILQFLVLEIRINGPHRKQWRNYGKLKGKKDCYHCHLKKGNPTYVVVWKVTERMAQIVEVRYVGTHEKANYRRIC